jgi:PPK2 family polyphosphate:nucleotide phosphotransferase
MPKHFTIEHNAKVNLADIPTGPGETEYDKKSAYKKIEKNAKEMADLFRRLYAENTRSILLVLQGMDTAGKDGTIRTVMRGVNPRSCQVVSFKVPSEEEREHDFLWRIHKAVPRRGNIGIFNRSHYEDVLVVRVHSFVPEEEWKQRYDQINDFEKMLSENGTKIVKCFLHISKEAQKDRLQARLDEPESNWKFNRGDLKERGFWDDYQDAYTDALEKSSTKHSPWHVIPSDKKWYRNLVVSELLLETIHEMDPQYPESKEDFSDVVIT